MPHPGNPLSIAVRCISDDPERLAYSSELARALGLPRDQDSDTHALLLVVTDERLELRQRGSSEGPVYCEFAENSFTRFS